MGVKLSIIVPIYNVQQYLRKCVDSLLCQDYSDYEILLVDDGSTDESGKIADTIALEHPDIIRVIHQENQGLSGARNTGIANCSGEYVVFVDSDDYWQPNVLETLMAQVERDQLDVLRFKYQHVNDQYEVSCPYKSDPYQFDDYSESVEEGLTFLNERLGTACYACSFIVCKSLLSDCLFTPRIYFEDTDWTPRMLQRAERVASTNMIVYNYLVREGSITHAVSRSKQQKVLDDKMRLVSELQRQRTELEGKQLPHVWFDGMIAATVLSIISILSTDFYTERKYYLQQLSKLKIYPLVGHNTNELAMRKVRLINISARMTVELLHLKNR